MEGFCVNQFHYVWHHSAHSQCLLFALRITFFLKVVDIRTFLLYFSWLLHLLSFQMLSIEAKRRVLGLNEVILWVLGPNVVPGDQFQSYFLLDEPSKLFSPMHVGQWMNCKCCFHFFFLCVCLFLICYWLILLCMGTGDLITFIRLSYFLILRSAAFRFFKSYQLILI